MIDLLFNKKQKRVVIPGGSITTDFKKDAGKVPMQLLSRVALEGTAAVLAFGAEKYSPDGWREQAGEWRRMIGAAMRHLTAFMDGEDIDPESGLLHLDHLSCCVMFLQEYQKKNLGIDDRYKRTP